MNNIIFEMGYTCNGDCINSTKKNKKLYKIQHLIDNEAQINILKKYNKLELSKNEIESIILEKTINLINKNNQEFENALNFLNTVAQFEIDLSKINNKNYLLKNINFVTAIDTTSLDIPDDDKNKLELIQILIQSLSFLNQNSQNSVNISFSK